MNYDLDHLYYVLRDYELKSSTVDAKATALATKPKQRINRNRVLFPKWLYIMLEEASSDKNDYANLIAWIPEGGFIVLNKECFESLFLPKYFKKPNLDHFRDNSIFMYSKG